MNTNNRRHTDGVSDNDNAIALVMVMMLFFWIAVIGAVLMYSGYAMTGQSMVVLGTTVTCGCFIRLILK